MNKMYFTITGTCFRFGQDFFEPDMNVKLIKEPDNEYDKEAIRVVSAMPHWQPGKQRGKPVRVRFTLPVTFRLQ